MGDENPIHTLKDYSKPSHEGYKNTIELLVGNNMVPLRSDTIQLVQNGCLFHGLRSEDPNQHLKDFLKLMDSHNLDGENRERTRLCLFKFFLYGQARHWLERLPAGSITTWEDLTTRFLAQFFPQDRPGPHDTQYCMEDPEQAFVEYATSRTDEAGGLVSEFMAYARLSKFEVDFKRKQGKMTNKIDTMLKAVTDQIAGTLPNNTVKNLKLGTHPVSTEENKEEERGSSKNHLDSPTPPDPLISLVTDKSSNSIHSLNLSDWEGPEAGVQEVKYFDMFITRSEITYHKFFMRKLNPRENVNGGISNFTRRINEMHIFIGNFSYVVDFMIVEDISSIIDPRLSQVVLGRPFIEISNMTHDLPKGVVRFTNKNDEVAYKMRHKIEQYNTLSNLEKEHTKSVYLRNEEDKIRGVDYVMSKILGFYKECLELGPEYVTGLDDEGEVT
nr:MAK10-like protein [Tanacetum cinerariifolium]